MELKEKLIGAFLGSAFWRKFAAHWMAYFTFRWFGWPKLPKSKYFEIKRAVDSYRKREDGFLAFVSVDRFVLNYKINHLLTGALWSHAGFVYFDHENELRIKHLLNDGLNDDYLLDLMGELDGIAILWVPLRVPLGGTSVLWGRVRTLEALKGQIQYDYPLELDPQVESWITGEKDHAEPKSLKLYCSEYVYLLGAGGLAPTLAPTIFAGRRVFEPDSLYAQSQVIFEARY